MQLDDATYAAYKGKDLENAVAYDNQTRVMKRDPNTDYCVKFTNGICSIHKDYGAAMLGDACNFYPRVTRTFESQIVMTATLSCPEITRLALFEENADYFTEIETERLPSHLNDYNDAELTAEQLLKIHSVFLNASHADEPADKIMARIYSVSSSISRIAKKDWPDATGFFMKTSDMRLAEPVSEEADIYKVLQIFAAVFHATKKKMNPRLIEVLINVENKLGIKIDWETLGINFQEDHQEQELVADDAILRKYISAQLSFGTFPFAGLGENPIGKAKLLAYKFALTKIMISGLTEPAEIIQTIQSAARVIDHIASPELIFNLMGQFGWNTEGRIMGLFS